ncbi:MAG: MATE family efflux transporter [Prevotella sp.]
MKQYSNNQKTLELGTRPVGRLLVEYALPAIIAMTASSLYNMVDSIFIGQGVGALAISGLAVTFPFMNLSAAFGAAVGVGASSYISVKLGQKDYAKALRVFGNTVTLNVIIGILFSTISLLLLDPILYFFGASDQTISYAREYMIIILLGNVITHLYFGMNAVLRSASKPRAAMFIIIFTVVLNTLLDPLFIYTFDLGIAGAAYATILAQLLAFLWQLKLFSDKREILHLQRGIYKPSLRIIRNILAIGMSPFFMNACACVIVIFINRNLLTYGGDLAVGAYGIANRVAFIFVMVTMGVNQGMQPIAGYNYGAQKFDRLLRVLKLAMISATCVTTSGFLVAEFCPRLCVSLFTDDAQLTSLSINGLRILMAAMPIVGYQMVITNFFQSIGMAKISIVLSLSRQLLLLLPLLILLPPYFGIDGVWMSMPVSDTLSALLAFVVMSRYMKKFTMLHQQLNVLS